MEFEVTAAESGQRLDQLLAARFPQLSRMRLREALRRGEVTVDGAIEPPGRRLAAGQLVRAELDLEATSAMTPEAIPLTLLFEDAALVVVDKPSGMVAHPAGRHRSGTLANALAHHFNVAGAADPPVRPGLAHRLDRATSGLMVVAKTQSALSLLTIQFQERRVTKRYLALVHGAVEAAEGEWEASIGADVAAFPRWGIRPGGRPARTCYAVRERLPGHTLLELEPVTGRTNQLRLHCAHFGHPIVGDGLFGRGEEPDVGRLFLHAWRLEFVHPVTGDPMAFASPLPAGLAKALEARQGEPAAPRNGETSAPS